MIALRDWQLSAAEQQQTFYSQFGDRKWDLIPRTDANSLNTKISFTLYSTPYETCTLEQQDSINATREKVMQLCGSGDVHFGCTFVSVLPTDTKEPCIVSLIRTKQTYGDDVYFIERQPGRVYTGWPDYLDNTKLCSSTICYPAEGFYQARSNQRVNIEFADISGKSVVGAVLDATSSVAKIASSGLIAASLFFPLAIPVVIGAGAVLGASTAYSVTREVIEIVDRDSHHESVGAEMWISIGVDVIGAVLMGGAAVLPRLVASGRLASSMASIIMDVFNWVSIGVNSFGVLANVAILIGKLRSGTLESSDIAYFISSCLFIGNIVVNTVVAERVIQSLSNRPSQVGNIFKMISTTSFSTVKTISVAMSWEVVIETICGDTVVAFMRYVGMRHFSQFLKGVKGLLKRFRQGVVNVWSLCVELQHLLSNHLMEVMVELLEAWKNIRAFFIGFNLPGEVFVQPSLEAAEIVYNAERVVDMADIHDDEARNAAREDIMRAALQIASNMNAQTEREFSNLSQMAMNDIRRRCDRKFVLAGSQGDHLFPEDRRAALREAIEEFRNEFETNAKASEMNGNTIRKSKIPLLPLSTSDDFDVYVFQVLYRVPEFDQFVHDAACHLLKDDDFFEHCRIESEDGPVIVIRSLGNTVIFYYQQLQDSDTAIGFVLVKN